MSGESRWADRLLVRRGEVPPSANRIAYAGLLFGVQGSTVFQATYQQRTALRGSPYGGSSAGPTDRTVRTP